MGQESAVSTLGAVPTASIPANADKASPPSVATVNVEPGVQFSPKIDPTFVENTNPKLQQDEGVPLASQGAEKTKCCQWCRTPDGRSWSWKKIMFGIFVFVVVVITVLFVYFRIAYKGFFTPKCAKPQKEIASLETLDSCMAEITDEYGLVGVAVAIVTSEAKGVAWSQTYGYANIETGQEVKDSTPFLLSSVSKTFIAVALMQQVEIGKLDLDEDINVYLPFEVINPLVASSSNNRITLRDLSTHTSGIVDSDYAYDLSYGPGDPTESLGDFLRAYFVPEGAYYSDVENFVPCLSGECLHEYSNVGAALAAFVLEAALGISYAQYVEENILAPLGMNDSHYYLSNYSDPNIIAMPYTEAGNDPEPYGYYGYPTYPDGRLFASSRDLSKFLASIMIEDGSTPHLLSAKSKREMLTPQPIHEEVSFAERLLYGPLKQEIFWVQTNGITHGHDGGDYGSFTLMYFEPNHGVGIIVLTNYDGLNGSIALINIVKQVTEQSARVAELLRLNKVI